LEEAKKNYYSNVRLDVIEHLPRDITTLLDIGCGTGEFCNQLKTYCPDLETWGVEINEEIAKVAQTKLHKVFIGDVNNFVDDLPKAYFDLITCNDLLEHLSDPHGLLKKLKDKLSKQGCVAASIPNMRFWPVLRNLVFRKQWEYQDSGILDRTHVRFFTETSIKNMFAECGYEIIKFEGLRPRRTRFGFRILNFITRGAFLDTQYPQFVCVVKPKSAP